MYLKAFCHLDGVVVRLSSVFHFDSVLIWVRGHWSIRAAYIMDMSCLEYVG